MENETKNKIEIKNGKWTKTEVKNETKISNQMENETTWFLIRGPKMK